MGARGLEPDLPAGVNLTRDPPVTAPDDRPLQTLEGSYVASMVGATSLENRAMEDTGLGRPDPDREA
jgi:hypothetical protein